MKKVTLVLTILIALLLIANLPVYADIMIDLNDFWPDPTVTVATNGSTATLAEDSNLFVVSLINDPGFIPPDPEVITPGPGMELLKFEYNFTEGSDNVDEFGALVFDPITGFSLGTDFEFFTQETSFGSVTFDLSAFSGEVLGLLFELTAFDSLIDSEVTVSNVRLAPVPEPATMILVGTGLVGLLGFGRKKFRKTS